MNPRPIRSWQRAARRRFAILAILLPALAGLTLGAGRPVPASAANPGHETWDSRFNVRGTDGPVDALAGAGPTFYVGGTFTTAGPLLAANIARWDGTAWAALGSGVDGEVDAIAVDGTHVYVGGNFSHAGGIFADDIAMWDGAAWHALGAGVMGRVYALAVRNGLLYVGGSFPYAGGQPHANLATWDGSAWGGAGDADSAVRTLLVDGTDLLADGDFTAIGDTRAPHIARLTDAGWQPLGSGLNDRVDAIAVQDGIVYAGGAFTLSADQLVSRIARYFPDHNLWAGLGSGTDGDVRSLVFLDGALLAGGDFEHAGGLAGTAYLARWAGSAWSAVPPAIDSSLGYSVSALASGRGIVYIGGHFAHAAATNLAAWNGAWTTVGPGQGLTGGFGAVRALAVTGTGSTTRVYASGEFTDAGNTAASGLAVWDGTAWATVGGGVAGGVDAMVAGGNDVYVGGNFSHAGGIAANNVAMWDGSTWHALGSGLDGTVTALAYGGGSLYAAGSFTDQIARWDPLSHTWQPRSLGYDTGSVNALAVTPNGHLYAGGAFFYASVYEPYLLAVYDPGTGYWTELLAGTHQEEIDALAIHGNDVFVGGNFYFQIGNTLAQNLVRYDGTWHLLGTDGLPQMDVDALLVHGSNLYVGGTSAGAGGHLLFDWDHSTNTLASVGGGLAGTPFTVGIPAVHALAAVGSDLYVGGLFALAGQATPAANFARRYFVPNP